MKHKALKILLNIIMLVFAVQSIIIAKPAFAISDPDAIALISTKTKVFQNLYESGDILFASFYNISYSNNNTPLEPPPDAFVYGLYDTDGTSLLQARSLTSLTYGYGVITIYYSAGDAAALTWGNSYYLKLYGNPALFAGLTEDVNLDTYQLSGTDWITGTYDTAASRASVSNQALIYTFFSGGFSTMQTGNNISYLTLTGTAGYVLNALGRNLLLLTVPYFDYVCPDLFQTVIYTPTNTSENHTMAYQTELTVTQKLGTQIKSSFDGIGTMLGINGQMVAAMWAVGIVFLVASIVFLYTGNTTGATILAIPMTLAGVYVGAIPMAVFFLGFAIIVVYAAYFLILRGL